MTDPGRPGAIALDLSRPPLSASSAALWVALVLLVGCGGEPQRSPATVRAAEYAPVIEALDAFISAEMDAKGLPALSIALVDGQELVWAEGFGTEDVESGRPATAETVYRVGSVSKLFTDIAVMQLVERGEIDLDAPITSYLPDFAPSNPYGGAITLRQLMSHRSGLVREPPVGHYFDPDEPPLSETVESLNSTSLVYPPESRYKYSNAAIAVVGYVLEHTHGVPFADYLAQAVLRPIGMTRSAFAPSPAVTARLADAVMWSYDGREFPAPTFQLGMAPAGSMYAPVTDLARFMSMLFAGGEGEGGTVVSRETLEAMWTPQFAPEDATEGGGIGFAVRSLEGHRQVGHGGAIYGFSTQLAALPDDGLGVVVATTRDFSNAVAGRVATTALRLMLAHRSGDELPKPATTDPLAPGRAHELAGRYEGPRGSLDLEARGERLYLTPSWGGYRVELREQASGLAVDDRHAFGLRLSPGADGSLDLGGERYARVETPKPPPPPERWAGLIGEYGWDHNVLFVFERDGRLWALIEWLELNPLDEVGPDRFMFPADRGLYHGEGITFERDESGRAVVAVAAGIPFPRRSVGPEDGSVFRIDPVRPVDELRAEAMAASPPVEDGDMVEPDLVELTGLDPTIRLDIRYAGTDNFMSEPFYRQARAFMQRRAAEALVRAHNRLGDLGYGLLIHDAYRPWHVTKMFWDATPEDMKIFVANPANGSRHNRGAAVDLTLFDRATGLPIEATGVYDEFSERSFPDYPGGTSLQRWHRELLRNVMEDEGFTVYEFEWWHFDFDGWSRYPILDLTFEELPGAGG